MKTIVVVLIISMFIGILFLIAGAAGIAWSHRAPIIVETRLRDSGITVARQPCWTDEARDVAMRRQRIRFHGPRYELSVKFR